MLMALEAKAKIDKKITSDVTKNFYNAAESIKKPPQHFRLRRLFTNLTIIIS
ncbi:hypothetical protein FIC_00185 [Flavobacteriaceae bacterium 3519-10]|nr:hypothetical protein FIC_00185 [Flavobacteriaceae bacterium 3519-10]